MSTILRPSSLVDYLLPALLALGLTLALALPSLAWYGDEATDDSSSQSRYGNPYGSHQQSSSSSASHNPPSEYYGEQYPGQRSGLAPELPKNSDYERLKAYEDRAGYEGASDPRYNPDTRRYGR